MSRRARQILIRAIPLIMMLFLLSGRPSISAQDSAANPAAAAQVARAALFTAQQALLAGDVTGARASFKQAQTSMDSFLPSIASDQAATKQITEALTAAATAIDESDGAALALARAEVWTATLRASYGQTIAAVAVGDYDQAGSWLLLRDFRPTTRFSRPGTDSTTAIQNLAQGKITPEQAQAIVTADLLDTYQGQVDSSLSALDLAADQGFQLTQAESAGLAAGYWLILAGPYEQQRGVDARKQGDGAFAELTAAAQSGDTYRLSTARAKVDSVMQGFRAAPLSEDEQARRAGQLLRFLSLVPVEYGRGVKQGQVIIDLEIQEAQAFLDGARTAFGDIRPTLDQQDPATSAVIASKLDQLDKTIRAVAKHDSVADPNTVRDTVKSATSDLKGLFPEAWTRPGGDADFDVIASILDQMEAGVAAGQYEQAESSRLEAYAIFEAGPENTCSPSRHISPRRWNNSSGRAPGSTTGLAYSLKDAASSQQHPRNPTRARQGTHRRSAATRQPADQRPPLSFSTPPPSSSAKGSKPSSSWRR